MEENEIKKVKTKFWINLLLSFLALNELKDVMLVLYEIYVESGTELNIVSGAIMAIFWIAFAKSTITSTIKEFKILKDFNSDEYIQNEDESDKNL